MGERRFRTMVVATTLWSVMLVGTALADPYQAKGQADAEQLASGGQLSAAVSVTERQGRGALSGPRPQTPAGTPASESLVSYRLVPTDIPCRHRRVQGRPVDGPEGGIIYRLLRVDRSTTPPTRTFVNAGCVLPDEAPDSLPPPAPPPTQAELSALARDLIIVPDVRLSPRPEVGGVTGLQTWFWYDGQDEVTTTAEIRGYNVTAAMRPSRYYWDPDDPRGVVLESPRPGSNDEPAARWVYETKGDYSVRVQVVWDGTWSYTGFGAEAGGDLPTIRATGTTDYRVDEVRSELTGTR